MPKLQEKYDSKEAAVKAFEALLIDADGDDGGVTLHDDVIKQFKIVNDTTGNLSAARKAEREAKAKLKKYEDALEGREIDGIEEALEELEDLRARKEEFEAGTNKDAAELQREAREAKAELKKLERELGKSKTALEERDAKLGEVSGELGSLRFESVFAKKAKEFGIKNGLDDLRDVAMSRYQFDEDGQIIPKRTDGDDFETFMESKRNNPIYTADITAGGMNDRNSGGGGGKRTYKRAEFDTLSKENPTKAAEVMTSVRKGEAQLVD